MRIGITVVLLTASVSGIVYTILHTSKKRLKMEQKRCTALAKRFQAMFDQHSACKVVFDPATGIIIDVNPAVLNFFGYTREEVIDHQVYEFNLLSHEVHNNKLQEYLNGKELFTAAPYRIKNGDIKYMDVHASVVENGEQKLIYAILFDVTDRERYREELYKEKEFLRTTLQSIGDGVVTTNNDGIITNLNNVAEKLTGWESASAIGKPFKDVFLLQNEKTKQSIKNPVQKVLETGRVIGLANYTELKNRRGEYIPIADSAAPIKASDGKIFGVVMVFRDVSDEKEHNSQIEFLSYHDSLTGLYNRRYIEEAIVRLDTTGELPVSVIMVDVNGLKITNDVFGHKAGDELLKSVALLLKDHCGRGNMVARWGGDEFVILMPGISLDVAEAIISDIKNNHIKIENSGLSLSLSLGCACKDTAESSSIKSAMQQAEEHMYNQKLLDNKSYRNSLVSTLLATLYEKSNETEEHSKRLEEYCHAIGRNLQLSYKEMDKLSLLALLHDIGKVSINTNILQKPGPLTAAEWDEMERHPEIGYRIAQATPELFTISELILSHHERWDGKGYPRGLKGEDIPLPCRILAVTDSFDAMTNDRPYRKAMSIDEAVQELIKNSGTQFDPAMVDLFIEILRSNKKINNNNVIKQYSTL